MAPMNVGGLNDTDGKLSQRGIEYFVERAKGGAGMIIVGFTRTTREFEQAPDTTLARNTIADDKVHVSWLNELAESCHDYNTKVALQLSPGVGRQAGGYMQSKGLAIGPSEIPCFWPPHLNTKELSKKEITKLTDSFQPAAYYCRMAGIDAIHLHGHEGYLLDQFKTELWNNRTDEYGGSLEKRMRFTFEIIKAIRKGAGNDFPIIYRFGLSHEFEGGRTLSEGLEIATLLEQTGVNALDIDSGCYETWHLAHPPSTIPAGFKLDMISRVKEVVKIPVIASGKLGYPEVAEKAITSGAADFVCLGRPLIADPDWVNKLVENRADEIRPCIGCHEGCLKRIYDHKYISCAVNPAAGNEKNMMLEKTVSPEKILVIGGGVAGMEAARVLSERGHRIRLIEKKPHLGGNFMPEYLPDFKYDYLKYVQYLETQLSKLNVEVFCEHPFMLEDVEAFVPELVILAAGAKSIIPAIPGSGKIQSLSVTQAFQKRTTKEKIAVLGGGLIGTEAAINLAMNGSDVTLIEKKPEIATDAFLPNKLHLKILLAENNVKVLSSSEIVEIKDNQICCRNNTTSENITINDVEKIVYCLGMEADTEVLEILKQTKTPVIKVGDCIAPGKVIDAVWEAYRKARLI